MFTYILRRILLMVPTLFGVTVVSFLVMELAPGDPLMYQLSGGSAGQSVQSRDAYVLQKRELHLDLPVLLNFNYFKDYTAKVHWAAYYRGRTIAEIRADLPALAKPPVDPETASRLAFVEWLPIPHFRERLADPERWGLLAQSIDYFAMVFSEDVGGNGVSPAIGILRDPHANLKLKIGAIKCLRRMVPNPFIYTYPTKTTPPSAKKSPKTPAIVAAWQLWWNRHKKSFPPVDPEVRRWLEKQLAAMLGPRKDLFRQVGEVVNNDDYADIAPRFFAEKLLDPASPLQVKFVAAVYLKAIVRRAAQDGCAARRLARRRE